MPSQVNLKALGLNKSPNFLDAENCPVGSMNIASNIVIKRNNIVEPRRGYKLYGTAIGTSTDRAKQLATYKGRILRHYSNKLEFDTLAQNSDSQSIYSAFSGTYLEPETGRRIRFIESNGNFYFTTANGIQKISAKTASDFITTSGFINTAGGIKAISLNSRLKTVLGNISGFLPQDSAVAYRSVWGSTDANSNEILGTPSQRSVIYNPLINLELLDFNNLLVQLDNISNNSPHPSLISDTNYFSTLNLPINASPTTLQSYLINLVAKLDNDILFADTVSAPLQISGAHISSGIGTVSFSSGTPSSYFSPGDKIILSGFSPAVGTLNTNQVVSSTSPTFSTTGTTAQGVSQVTTVQTVADSGGSLAGTFFPFYAPNDETAYYVWYNVSGSGIDPNIAGKRGIRVNIATGDTTALVASKTTAAINANASSDFTCVTLIAPDRVQIDNNRNGPSTNVSPGSTGFTMVTTTSGTVGNVLTSVASTTGVHVGMKVAGTGIPANTYVTAVSLSTVTISNDVTSNNVGTALTFDAILNFVTTATGTVTTLSPTINSFAFEAISRPGVPSIPATNDQLVALQVYLQAIITELQSEPTSIISANSQTTFISPIEITSTSTVILKIDIPSAVTVNNFLQIYRSTTALATGTQVLTTDIFPNDELKLVYEAFPTATDISNGYITVEDITPSEFAGEFLYTNATTGSGILQSNDVPPFALDVNRFKNVLFYANTKTRYSQLLNLLGVTNMATGSKITISDGIRTDTYNFVTGLPEKTLITTVADVAGSLAGKYFKINSANDETLYTPYFIVNGVGADPAISGRVSIPVYLNTGETNTNVAQKLANRLAAISNNFTVSVVASHAFTVTNVNVGSTTDALVGTSGFTISVSQQGRGADPSINQVLLSTNVSPAQAVDETARSLVDVINQNPSSVINAFYLSDVQAVPGQLQFEAKSLNQSAFYILANNSATGTSFNPDISPSKTISSNTLANPTVITTSTSHGLINQDKVVISGSNSTPSIDGLYTITYISPTTFSIPVNVTIAGTSGSLKPAVSTLTATDLVKPNRIYFSKLLQPEAVPAVNFVDVGAQDKAILRIFPLRDSLLIFKEDGLYRLSGEVAPFTVSLLDLSCILIAPDSLDVSNNLLYGWTTQGLASISEQGPTNISRPVDVDILPLATPQYSNFKTATWGIGYESDNSYTVYTVNGMDDVYPTIAYRYSTLTNTWTTFDKTANCGVINSVDDKQYLGVGDTNFLEQERKNFNRLDYSDREYLQNIISPNLRPSMIQIQNVAGIQVGDVVTQDQYLSVYNYNSLLSKLDTDVILSPHSYTSSLLMAQSDDPRIKLDALIDHIATDVGRVAAAGSSAGTVYTKFKSINGASSITSISSGNPTVLTKTAHGLQTGRSITISGSNSVPSIDGIYQVTVLTADTFTIPTSVITPGTTASYIVNNSNFLDIQTSFNGMILALNADAGTGWKNYSQITNSTLQEAIITDFNILTKWATLNLNLDFIVGPVTIFKAINSTFQYTPLDMQDPVSLKHFSDTSVFFEDKAFTTATLSFASDLLPAFQPVPVIGTGNGIFGFTNFGYGFFGGASHSAPFRTYVPRSCQRCRFLNVQFNHQTAREKFSLQGISINGNNTGSTRGYR